MPTRKTNSDLEPKSATAEQNAPKNEIGLIIFFMLITAFITITATWIMIHGGKIAGMQVRGVKDEFLALEYEKDGGKDNYDIIQKVQKQQIEQYVAQYKKQNGGAAAAGNDTTTNNNNAAAADIKTMSQDEVKALKDSSYFEGKKDAKITVYEFSDLECPFCIRQFKEGTIQKVLEKFPDQVNTAFKNFPLEFHKNAPREAQALLCVGQLAGADKYIDFHKKIFERTTGNGEGFSLDNLAPLAKEIGVDQKKFSDCFDNSKTADALKADQALGSKYGVTGTPGNLVVNNETGKYVLIAGAYPADEFISKINDLLK